jgi:heat shock protein HslJ
MLWEVMTHLKVFLIALAFVSLPSESFCADPLSVEVLTGTEWKWQGTLYGSDERAVPSDPTHYTLTFRSDGSLGIRADCNRAGGVYTFDDGKITIQVTHSTRAACPPESLEGKFLRDLNSAARCFLKDGFLYLDLRVDTGTMKFRQ